jgi:transcriptional regulator of arginine metabolism
MEGTVRRRRGAGGAAAREARLEWIRALVARERITSQQQLADRLAEHGFAVDQATVSRDIARLGLVKVARGEQHVYAAPERVAAAADPNALLRRAILTLPIDVRRSGLTLVLVATPGSGPIVGEAIDRSSLEGPVGTLAGDDTILVLFADEAALEAWAAGFEALRADALATARG